ncbi:MAG: hypothetical protein V4508_11645 [Pseudomonadota bacterium]
MTSNFFLEDFGAAAATSAFGSAFIFAFAFKVPRLGYQMDRACIMSLSGLTERKEALKRGNKAAQINACPSRRCQFEKPGGK